MKFLKIALTVFFSVILVFLAANTLAHSFNRGPTDPEKVSTEVKNITNGIQLTITSDDKETAERIKDNSARYKNQYSGTCNYGGGFGHMHGMHWHYYMHD